MNTTDQKNSMIQGNRIPENQNQNTDKSNLMNEELYDIDDMKESDTDNSEIAERGYTVRNGHNPDTPNPDELTDDEDDLTDDFHSENDLNSNTDDLYEEELDQNGNNVDDVDDELDNPSDASLEREEEDFNETEDVLEDIDDEEEVEETEYIEDDVQEEEDVEYPDNDPRKF